MGWAAWRARGGPLDAAIALFALLADVPAGLWAVAGGNAEVPVPPVALAASLVSSLGLCLPLAVRRLAPRTAAVLVLAALAFTALTHGPSANSHAAVFGLALVAGSLRTGAGRPAVIVFTAAAVAVFIAGLPLTGPWFLLYLPYLVVGAVVGEVVAVRQGVQQRLQRRVAQDAVLGERVRIARDMHDIVTHAVSLMVVQAEGARLAVRRDPDRAEQAMGTVAETGRQTLDELRGLVGALRRGAEPTDPPLDPPVPATAGADRPQTGPVGDLAGLAATMRAAGLDVRLDPPRPLLPPGLHATGYRIVQESLTNCLRHAPADARVTVAVADGDGRLRISVVDDGGPAGAVAATGAGGSGLVGMRERARAAGGALVAGPVPAGGWCVDAELPLPGSGSR